MQLITTKKKPLVKKFLYQKHKGKENEIYHYKIKTEKKKTEEENNKYMIK